MRTTVQQNKANCSGCGACLAVCPKSAIRMERDAEGFLYPQVSQQLCIECGLCEKKCPFPAARKPALLESRGGLHTDSQIREKSSSGGIFMALAQHVIEQGGVVFGTVWNDSFGAEIVGAFRMDEVERMCGSKYLQSTGYDALQNAAALVRQGITVLFSGTPCQIAGLYVLTGGRPSNLITVDFVCHGVPSPAVFESALRSLEKGKKAVRYSFRDKRKGWQDFQTAVLFDDGSEYTGSQTVDPFMRGFLNNLYLRPSCHNCRMRGEQCPADLTIADLWGAQDLYPEQNDDRGLSLVLVHTGQGRSWLERCTDHLKLFPVDSLEPMRRSNPSLFSPVPPHRRRERFFKIFEKKGFSSELVDKCLEPPGFLERSVARATNLPQAVRRRLRLSDD